MDESAQASSSSFLSRIFFHLFESNHAKIIIENDHLVIIAIFGGIVLFAIKLAEHFNRDQKDKLSIGRYVVYIIFLLTCLPFLGGAMVSIYIDNGDKISPLLAFQVGLTSPAIAQSLIMGAANKAQKYPIKTPEGA